MKEKKWGEKGWENKKKELGKTSNEPDLFSHSDFLITPYSAWAKKYQFMLKSASARTDSALEDGNNCKKGGSWEQQRRCKSEGK